MELEFMVSEMVKGFVRKAITNCRWMLNYENRWKLDGEGRRTSLAFFVKKEVARMTKHAPMECTFTRRKTEINYKINDSFLSRLGHKRPINDSNNEIGFESLWTSRLGHLSRLCKRGCFSSKG
jgi:hypothetical protein